MWLNAVAHVGGAFHPFLTILDGVLEAPHASAGSALPHVLSLEQKAQAQRPYWFADR